MTATCRVMYRADMADMTDTTDTTDIPAAILAHVRVGRVARRAGRRAACDAVATLLEQLPGSAEVVAVCRAAATAITQRGALALAHRWSVLACRPPRPPLGDGPRMTCEEVAAWCGVSMGTVVRWRHAGHLVSLGEGRPVRFSRANVERVAQLHDSGQLRQRS